MESLCKDAPMEEDVDEMEDDEEEEEEEVEDEDEEVDEEEEEEEGDNLEVTVGRRSGRGLTLKTLLKERILEPGEGNMTINYLGNKFKGDLLSDGRIRSQETGKIFGTPSAWAIYCKKIVNPDKKSGCGWASVRYRGKKLDTYKNNWFRQKRLEYEKEEELEEEELSSEEEVLPPEQEIVEFELLGNRNPNHEPSTMVELATFQSLGRMQPFNITMSSSAMAVIDVHAHLSTSEVVGYLAGQWDVNNHNFADLIVSHALPVRCRLGDNKNGPAIEQELYAEMTRLKLSLVGWYHTHPFAPPLPSIRDIDSQLDYEMKMKGYNDASYTPVLGIIVSPYEKKPTYSRGIPHPNGNAAGFWVMPPAENKPLEYGKPMSMQFTVVQDAFIPKEALLHMSEIVKYYHDSPDSVTFTDCFDDKITFWHQLRNSLQGRVPKDHFPPLIDYLRKIIGAKLPEEDPPPITTTGTTTTTTTSQSAPISTNTLPPSPSTNALNLSSTCSPPTSTTPTFSAPGTRPSSRSSADLPANLSKDKESDRIKIPLSEFVLGVFPPSESVRERDSMNHPLYSHSPSPSPGIHFSTPEKYSTDEEPSLCPTPKAMEERTPPPKSFSPLFSHPPPPLFPIESPAKANKDILPPALQSLLQLEEKRPFELIQKSLSALRDTKALSTTSEVDVISVDALRTSNKCSTPISKSSHIPSAYATNRESDGGFLDLSIGNTKASGRSSADTLKHQEESNKESKDRPTGLAAWFAQQGFNPEAFALSHHERENPFLRDPHLLHRDLSSLAAASASASSSATDFNLGTSQWNTGLNFARDLSSQSHKTSSASIAGSEAAQQHDAIIASYARKSSASPTNFSFSLDHPSKDQHRESMISTQHNRDKSSFQADPLAPYIREDSGDQRDFRTSSQPFPPPHRKMNDQPPPGEY